MNVRSQTSNLVLLIDHFSIETFTPRQTKFKKQSKERMLLSSDTFNNGSQYNNKSTKSVQVRPFFKVTRPQKGRPLTNPYI